MSKLSIILAYSWEVKISGISQEFCNNAENSRSYSFSALHDSQIQMESILKESYITIVYFGGQQRSPGFHRVDLFGI